MVSFVQWMKEQEKREGDPVGWFACYWRDLDGKPRLSSPSSIARYLEDQGLFQSVNGLTEGFDATLAEYRHVREGVVRSTAQGAGIQLPEHGPQEPAEAQTPGLAGQAVAQATAAGLAAAERHAQRHGITATPDDLANRIVVTTGQPEGSPLDQIHWMLNAVYRKLERIERAMGLATDEDGGAVPAQLPWSAWYEQAAVYVTARGDGWDQEEA